MEVGQNGGPKPQTTESNSGLRPVRNQATQQDVGGGAVGRAGKGEGGEQQSFSCISSCSPLPVLLPELRLLSDQRRCSILIEL